MPHLSGPTDGGTASCSALQPWGGVRCCGAPLRLRQAGPYSLPAHLSRRRGSCASAGAARLPSATRHPPPPSSLGTTAAGEDSGGGGGVCVGVFGWFGGGRGEGWGGVGVHVRADEYWHSCNARAGWVTWAGGRERGKLAPAGLQEVGSCGSPCLAPPLVSPHSQLPPAHLRLPRLLAAGGHHLGQRAHGQAEHQHPKGNHHAVHQPLHHVDWHDVACSGLRRSFRRQASEHRAHPAGAAAGLHPTESAPTAAAVLHELWPCKSLHQAESCIPARLGIALAPVCPPHRSPAWRW